MSSTLLTEDTGVPFDELQAEQIALYRAAWAEAGWEREPRVSVSRSVLPIVDRPRPALLRRAGPGDGDDQVGYLDGGARPVRQELRRRARRDRGRAGRDAAVREADTLLLTVPNQLGVDYNAHLLETIAQHIAPAIGWSPRRQTSAGQAAGDREQEQAV